MESEVKQILKRLEEINNNLLKKCNEIIMNCKEARGEVEN